jgi:hypothetical protein
VRDGVVDLDPTDEVVDAVWVRPAEIALAEAAPAEVVPEAAVAAADAAPETLPEGE